MFGLFSPKCSLGLTEKTWIEWRWRWLGQQLGWETLLTAPVYLLDDVPHAAQRRLTESDAEEMFQFICESMKIDPSCVRMVIGADSKMESHEAFGLYEQRGTGILVNSESSLISLASKLLDDPQRAVGVLAHELAHEILLGGGLLDREDDDGEWLTDLLPVFFGYGLFLANGTIREQNNTDSYSISQSGYLPSRMFGHALALFAWFQENEDADWIKQLRLDAQKPCIESLRYFQKTADALVTPKDARATPETGIQTVDVRKTSPTQRLGFLWDTLGETGRIEDLNVIPKITELLTDKHTAIRKEAVDCLRQVDDLPEAAREGLLTVMRIERDPECRINSILTLNHHDSAPDEAFDVLRVSLRGLGKQITELSAYAIGELAKKTQLPSDQPRLVPAILKTADQSLRVGEEDNALRLLPALIQIKNLADLIHDEYSNWDDERQNQLIEFVTKQK